MNINTPSKAVYSSTPEVGRRFLLHSMRKPERGRQDPAVPSALDPLWICDGMGRRGQLSEFVQIIDDQVTLVLA